MKNTLKFTYLHSSPIECNFPFCILFAFECTFNTTFSTFIKCTNLFHFLPIYVHKHIFELGIQAKNDYCPAKLTRSRENQLHKTEKLVLIIILNWNIFFTDHCCQEVIKYKEGQAVYFATKIGGCSSLGVKYVSRASFRTNDCGALGGKTNDLDPKFCDLDWCKSTGFVDDGLYIR